MYKQGLSHTTTKLLVETETEFLNRTNLQYIDFFNTTTLDSQNRMPINKTTNFIDKKFVNY